MVLPLGTALFLLETPVLGMGYVLTQGFKRFWWVHNPKSRVANKIAGYIGIPFSHHNVPWWITSPHIGDSPPRSVANEMGCSLILARPDPSVLLQMQNFGLPLFDLRDKVRIKSVPGRASGIWMYMVYGNHSKIGATFLFKHILNLPRLSTCRLEDLERWTWSTPGSLDCVAIVRNPWEGRVKMNEVACCLSATWLWNSSLTLA